MAAVTYPTNLPGPSSISLSPSERRLLSDLPGPQQARGIQRDYLASQQLEWSLLDATAAAAWQEWWKTTLCFGAAWFAATWPHPAGWQSIVRRFVGAPKWQHLAGGFWRVSVACEVRGRGLPPRDERDPLWDFVVLLARFNGADTGTVFTDLTGRHGLAAVGAAQTTTGLGVLGENSALQLNGTTDYVQVTGNLADFTFAGVPATYEIFADLQSAGSTRGLMGSSVGASLGFEWTIQTGGLQNMLQHTGTLDGISATRPLGTVPLNQFLHYAFTYDGAEGWFHFDGVYVDGTRTNTPFYQSTSDVRIGCAANGPYFWNGRLQEIRVTKGRARYPRADIAVPTSHFATHR